MRLALAAAALLATPAAAFEGTYDNRKPAGEYRLVRVTEAGADLYAVRIVTTLTTHGDLECAGDLNTRARVEKGTFRSGDDECPLSLSFQGRKVTIREEGRCDLRGARCTFNGTATRLR